MSKCHIVGNLMHWLILFISQVHVSYNNVSSPSPSQNQGKYSECLSVNGMRSVSTDVIA